ncbi:putative nucleoside 2-deoxyribosyltransferase [Methanocella paludicola SANAE]|uniref:Nucleoside 2-deoxyribosyltransferase n=1 Tax=Methanocella paludicola (strain DSM 17711 / JCM 13418 / NBRC 101707 / SANAE) TaxID=304371 RepID=D1YXI2_METPS|nr:nucleoside 2-deoxyribosyltransferase [Methanocella paludicola]BAI61154.1 putative nucleoside 2-deoxyribosyltransferase [Methanocella paludicola SANAE]
MRIFLSGPFFNDEEVRRIGRVKDSLEGLGFEVYSTSHRNPPIDLGSKVQKNRRFRLLCQEIEKSDGVFAVLDGKDAGTIWEMGYAFALGKPVAAFVEQDRYYSLMIDSSAHVVYGSGELDNRLEEFYRTGKPKKGLGPAASLHE